MTAPDAYAVSPMLVTAARELIAAVDAYAVICHDTSAGHTRGDMEGLAAWVARASAGAARVAKAEATLSAIGAARIVELRALVDATPREEECSRCGAVVPLDEHGRCIEHVRPASKAFAPGRRCNGSGQEPF